MCLQVLLNPGPMCASRLDFCSSPATTTSIVVAKLPAKSGFNKSHFGGQFRSKYTHVITHTHINKYQQMFNVNPQSNDLQRVLVDVESRTHLPNGTEWTSPKKWMALQRATIHL